jgi:DNA-binding response OmpR family regulator
MAAPSRVLVVEDEPEVAAVLHALVTDLGHDVLIAPDGADALRLFRVFRPNLVLLDLLLPEISGDTVFQCLRLADPAIRVILLSGATPEIARRTFARGAFAYIPKPFDLQMLTETVNVALTPEQ